MRQDDRRLGRGIAMIGVLCAICHAFFFFAKVGGIEEYQICEALRNGQITKPVIAWCIGTCAKMFTSEVKYIIY